MKLSSALCVTFLAIWSLAVLSNNETFVFLLILNAVIQVVLFLYIACIPFIKTGRMSVVDIAWPFGVAAIGVQILVFGETQTHLHYAVGSIYVLIGLRMGLGALNMARTTGVIVRKEFPRYEYRRLILEGTNGRWVRFHLLTEILMQGFANLSVLALPGIMMAVNPNTALSAWEVLGMTLWLGAFIFESTADFQKLAFMKRNRGAVCNAGLWRFSRHPNYFGEWLGWTGLVIASVPSWLAFRNTEEAFVWVALGVGALGASLMMYLTLVYLTGAIPAEYFSEKKRPDYKSYQTSTNRFFPWMPKT